MEIPKLPGSYIILSKLHAEARIGSGPFAGKLLPAGIYFYSGSAFGPGGLRARVGRHLRFGTKNHWHFDHLKDLLNIFEIWYTSELENKECQFIRKIQESRESSFPIPGFGSSDCRNQCPAHLAWQPINVEINSILNVLDQTKKLLQRVLIIKSDRIDYQCQEP